MKKKTEGYWYGSGSGVGSGTGSGVGWGGGSGQGYGSVVGRGSEKCLDNTDTINSLAGLYSIFLSLNFIFLLLKYRNYKMIYPFCMSS